MSGASGGGPPVESGGTDVVRVVFPSPPPPPPLPQELQQTSTAASTLPAFPLPMQRGVQVQAAGVLRQAVSGTKGAHCRHGSSSSGGGGGGSGTPRRPLLPSHDALDALACDPHVAELLSAAFWWCFLEDYESVPLVPGVDGPPPVAAPAAAAAATATATDPSRPAGGCAAPPAVQATQQQQPAFLKPLPPQRGSGGGGGGALAVAPVPPSPRGSHTFTSHLTAHGYRAAWVGRHSGGGVSPKRPQRARDRRRLSPAALLPAVVSAAAPVSESAAATATANEDANNNGSDTGSDCDGRERDLVAKSFGEYYDDWEFFLTAVGRRRRRSSASEGAATCPSTALDSDEDDASKPSPTGAALPSPPAIARASTALTPPALWSPAQRQDILFGRMAGAYAKAIIPLACGGGGGGGGGGAAAAATRAWRLLPDVLARALDAALREALPYAAEAHMGTPAAEVRRLTRRTTYWLHGVEHAPPSCAPPRNGRHNKNNSNSSSNSNNACEPSQPPELSPAADAPSDAPTDPAPTDTATPSVPVPAAEPTLPPATVSLKALRAEFAAVLHPRAKGGGSSGGGGEGGSGRSLALQEAGPSDGSTLASSPHTMPQPLCPWYETGRRSAAAQTRRKQATGYFSTDNMSPLLHRYASDHGKRAADAPRPSEMRWVLS